MISDKIFNQLPNSNELKVQWHDIKVTHYRLKIMKYENKLKKLDLQKLKAEMDIYENENRQDTQR